MISDEAVTVEPIPLNSEKKWILVVEDNKVFAEALIEDLAKVGEYRVVWASNFLEGVAKLNNQKFSCILLDLKLEKHSGIKLVQQLRSPNATKQMNSSTPIILMSGFLSGDVVVSIAGLVQGIIAKPFKTSDLLQKISEAMLGTQQPILAPDEKPQTNLATSPSQPPLNPSLDERPETKAKKTSFLHDISNSLAILDLSTHKLLRNLTEINATREIEITNKIDVQVKKIIALVKIERAKKNSLI